MAQVSFRFHPNHRILWNSKKSGSGKESWFYLKSCGKRFSYVFRRLRDVFNINFKNESLSSVLNILISYNDLISLSIRLRCKMFSHHINYTLSGLILAGIIWRILAKFAKLNPRQIYQNLFKIEIIWKMSIF